MPKDSAAKQIEKAVDAALERGDTDEAARLAAGHPDPAKHLRLMERINAQIHDQPADAGGQSRRDDEPAPAGELRMFELVERPAQLLSFNPRSEKHGDEAKPAADLKFRVNVPSTVLDGFEAQLRTMFFCKQGAQDLANESHEAPNLRSGRLVGPFKLSSRYAGYTLRIHLGTEARAHVVIGDVAVNKVAVTPMEGGSVIVAFRCQFHPDELIAGKLAMLVNNQVDVSLTPPEGGGEIIGDADEDEYEE